MDKIKQNIDLQEAIQRYNIEKSVVGTLAYNIEQNLQEGMSPDEAIENVLQKSKSMPIGTIHNGYKKIADGKWRKVSESHKMTKEEHEDESKNKRVIAWNTKDDEYRKKFSDESKLNEEAASKLDSKDYSDEEVTGGEKKESKSKYLKPLDEGMQDKLDYFKELPTLEEKEKYTDTLKNKWIPETEKDLKEAKFDSVKKIYSDLVDGFKQLLPHIEKELENFKNTQKSQPESTLSKSEQTEAQKAKVKKVMDEWKAGKLKSSSGEKVVSQSQALAIAMSEAGIEIQKSMKANIGDIHVWNGKRFKKQANGKWVEVSEHGMTQREHKDTAYKHEDAAVRTKPTSDKGEDDRVYAEEYKAKKHKELASKLDSQEYSDEDINKK